MKILLVNPPNCGRSIPEELYGITSLKQIFRGEPLALEELAGNLPEHDVLIIDLKVEPNGLDEALEDFRPDIVGITGVTCEANTMLKIASRVRITGKTKVVVGGIHASNDPEFFNHESIDFIVIGLGKRAFAELVEALERDNEKEFAIAGVIPTQPGKNLKFASQGNTQHDLVEERSPAYSLVKKYRSHYILEKLGVNMGFVASAFGCPHSCSFCCIKDQTGGKYLTKSIDAVIRDINLLGDIPVIRLVDANTFGDINRAWSLGHALLELEGKKQFLADIRSDTVVRQPDMLKLWKAAGLRAVIIGFEDIDDENLSLMNKANKTAMNSEAITILNDMGINIVGDFIISPDYDESDFERLSSYLENKQIDLPMITVMTPLPGTPLYYQQQDHITNTNLDYYTLTNAVTNTKLDEKKFYQLYANLLAKSHKNSQI